MMPFAILCAVIYGGLLFVTWIDGVLGEADAALADQGDAA